MNPRILPYPLFLACFVLPGCVGGNGGSQGIEVTGAWARAMPLLPEESGPTNSAVYLTLLNEGRAPARLVGAETPVASSVEIHESQMVDEVMRMRIVEGVDLPSGEEVDLRPGGLHLMLMGLTTPLLPGDTLDLVLYFEGSEDLRLTVPVRGAEGL
jgi:copper(I)-binding protein